VSAIDTAILSTVLTTTTGRFDVFVASSGVKTLIVKPCNGTALSATRGEDYNLTIFVVDSYFFIQLGENIADILF
jgi:hypothetical protein